MAEGELAIVLHTHMPYVEGFGRWPFGEEWLWEAITTSYLPLLDVLDGTEGAEHVTLSLTPVLLDQLEAPGAITRCLRFLNEVRPESHRLDIEHLHARGEVTAAEELERSAQDYARAAEALERLVVGSDGESGLVSALGRHATWTSSATHAVLPLIATSRGLELQIGSGIWSHRSRFGDWDGGFWLPECAFADWLPEALEDAGVRLACVELTDRFGLGTEQHLRPRRTSEGPLLIPLDREAIDLVWGEAGYPSGPAYRAYHNLTPRHHRPWANDGSVYDRERAAAQVEVDARDFVERVSARVVGGGLCVCALDTELLGHWWFEGPRWLTAVLTEAKRSGLKLTRLDEAAIRRHDPAPMPSNIPPCSWGEARDLRTWSGPRVADLAWRARSAELRAFSAPAIGSAERALRELLALQSSDWAFLAYRSWAGDYPRERAARHAASLDRALSGEEQEPRVRNLAPFLNR